MQKLKVMLLLLITIIVFQYCTKTEEQSISSYNAISAAFGNNIDPNNLANYANQIIPAYIRKDNTKLAAPRSPAIQKPDASSSSPTTRRASIAEHTRTCRHEHAAPSRQSASAFPSASRQADHPARSTPKAGHCHAHPPEHSRSALRRWASRPCR